MSVEDILGDQKRSITAAAFGLAAVLGAQAAAQALPEHSVRFDAEAATCRITFQPDARTGAAEPDLELTADLLSGRFDMGLRGGPYGEQAFLWGSTRTDLRPVRALPAEALAAEPAWQGLVAATAEGTPLYFTVRDSTGSYASVRYDSLTPDLILRTVALACDIAPPDLAAPTEIEARRAERRLGLSEADILHIRRVLNARYGEPGVQPGTGRALTVTDRRHIGQYSAETGGAALEYLTATTAAALLAEDLRLPSPAPLPGDAAEVETFRDWVLASEAAGATCAISTPARSGTGFTGTTPPRMRFAVDRSGSGGLMAIELSRPNPFAAAAPIRAIVAGQSIELFVEPSTGALVPRPQADGRLSNDFTVLLRQGDGAVIEGTSADTGAQLLLDYSGLGFTAAFRGMAERCNRPGILGWIG
jgi:hypothetical protein